MSKATWNGTILAPSDETVVVEGNQYFPPESTNKKYFMDSETQTICYWKGMASYYDIEVDGKLNKDSAWVYKNPKSQAEGIKNYVAFWRGVLVE